MFKTNVKLSMEPSALRTYMALFTFLLFFQTIKADPTFNPGEIKSRFETMECIVQPRYNTTVEGYIKKYLSWDARLASKILGRAATYFPIFEDYLQEHDLPQDLKFLAVLESALNPKATSPVGAVGLWQFMATTGKGYGLTINSEIDERSCPHNSTEAAMNYLSKAYERFGSWELALASYNCGAGNISRAMKRARTDDYWKLVQFLPRETRSFVPAFLAVAYIANYYHLHEINPDFPNLDMQLTEAVKVFDDIDFPTIAAVTGLPVEIVKELNPAFKKDKVPASENGYYVLLPRRVTAGLNEYLGLLRPDNGTTSEMPELPAVVDTSAYLPDEYYFSSTYKVAEGDKLSELGTIFKCSRHSLRAWNNLTSDRLKKGEELTVWFPKELVHFLPQEADVVALPAIMQGEAALEKQAFREEREIPGKLKMKSLKTIKPLSGQAKSQNGKNTAKKAPPTNAEKNQDPGFIYYQLQRNESLLDVAEQFPGVTLQNIMDWNEFSAKKPPMPGILVKIKKQTPGPAEK